MDEVFGVGVEDFFGGARGFKAVIDIGGGLEFGEGCQADTDIDASVQIGVFGAFKTGCEGFLSAEDDFEGQIGIVAVADKEEA